jgi:hypothetical protein
MPRLKKFTEKSKKLQLRESVGNKLLLIWFSIITERGHCDKIEKACSAEIQQSKEMFAHYFGFKY